MWVTSFSAPRGAAVLSCRAVSGAKPDDLHQPVGTNKEIPRHRWRSTRLPSSSTIDNPFSTSPLQPSSPAQLHARPVSKLQQRDSSQSADHLDQTFVYEKDSSIASSHLSIRWADFFQKNTAKFSEIGPTNRGDVRRMTLRRRFPESGLFRRRGALPHR